MSNKRKIAPQGEDIATLSRRYKLKEKTRKYPTIADLYSRSSSTKGMFGNWLLPFFNWLV